MLSFGVRRVSFFPESAPARSPSLLPNPPPRALPAPPSLHLGFALPLVPLPGAKSTIHQVLPSDTKHVPSILWLDISLQVFHVSLSPSMFGIQNVSAVLSALCPSIPLLQPLCVPLSSIYSLCFSSRTALSFGWTPSPPHHTYERLSVRQTDTQTDRLTD